MTTLPDLPYAYNALEPHIDEQTMTLHHDKHHAGYVKKYNKAVEGTKYEKMELDTVLAMVDDLPEDIIESVINNGGGASNHAKFWEWMSPNGGGEPTGEFSEALKEAFGTFDHFKDDFKEAATSLFGSGWVWLILEDGEIDIMLTQNQDSPVMDGIIPLLGLDVWEHAYYLKNQNKRGDYVDAFWNVVNWDKVSEIYKANK